MCVERCAKLMPRRVTSCRPIGLATSLTLPSPPVPPLRATVSTLQSERRRTTSTPRFIVKRQRGPWRGPPYGPAPVNRPASSIANKLSVENGIHKRAGCWSHGARPHNLFRALGPVNDAAAASPIGELPECQRRCHGAALAQKPDVSGSRHNGGAITPSQRLARANSPPIHRMVNDGRTEASPRCCGASQWRAAMRSTNSCWPRPDPITVRGGGTRPPTRCL